MLYVRSIFIVVFSLTVILTGQSALANNGVTLSNESDRAVTVRFEEKAPYSGSYYNGSVLIQPNSREEYTPKLGCMSKILVNGLAVINSAPGCTSLADKNLMITIKKNGKVELTDY